MTRPFSLVAMSVFSVSDVDVSHKDKGFLRIYSFCAAMSTLLQTHMFLSTGTKQNNSFQPVQNLLMNGQFHFYSYETLLQTHISITSSAKPFYGQYFLFL